MSNLPSWLARILRYEDARLGVAVAWLVGVPVLALAGFYLMTIIGKQWVVDYQVPDMVRGGYGAIGGMLFGVLVAVLVTVFYPSMVEAEEVASGGHHPDVVID